MLMKGMKYDLYAPNHGDAFSSLVAEKSFGKTCKHKIVNLRHSPLNSCRQNIAFALDECST
jgi:hypothetical protein